MPTFVCVDGLQVIGATTMREAEIRKAQAIVAAHFAKCIETWRRIHGEP